MAIAMIAAFLLIIGGIKLALRKEERSRGFLMIGAAGVLIMNVLIWTL
jgi:high-affinity Fe2+/Pb2+ permease